MTSRRFCCVALATAWLAGCSVFQTATPSLPQRSSVVRGQLWVYSDIYLPQRHRLLEELNAQRGVLATKLSLPTSDEPVYVYLFTTADEFKTYVHANFPDFPSRRAFFVENDMRLAVYAYWGDRVAEDLRHEVTHGYLHSVCPRIPLWIDEGLAEYFEVPAGQHGLHRPHMQEIAAARANGWKPNLRRLEELKSAGDMTQIDYAESWAWAHLLLETTPERQQTLHAFLTAVQGSDPPDPLSSRLRAVHLDYEQKLLEHLDQLEKTELAAKEQLPM